MTAETKQLVEVLIAILATVVLPLGIFHGSRAVTKAQKNMIEADTLGKLSSQIIDLQGKYNDLHKEQLSLRNQIEKLDDKNRILWQYVYALIEQIKKKKMTPIAPPIELESDPQLIKLLKVK